MTASSVSAARVAVDVLDSLLEGCQVIAPDWRYVFLNMTVARQAGRPREDLLGRTMMECFPGIEHTAMFAELQRCMRERVTHRMENEFTFPDGTTAWFELHFVPVPEGTCILSVDITERKQAEASLRRTEDQLRQAQKMEAVGRLAGNVAHDFNNMLTVILSYAGLARESAGDNAQLREDLAEIEKAGARAAELTRQLLTFSRRRLVAPAVLDLNDVLLDMENMLRRLVRADIDLRVVRSPVVGRILADSGQIQQVVMNLVVNAVDAMPQGGKVTIETANVELDDSYAREHLGVEPGPHVMLAVSDTGIGMDRDTRERLFEPFFTTKPAGRGTGLGLSIVFGIVQQAGGSIWVYSEPGTGTTFKVYFPQAEATVVPVTGEHAVPSAGSRPGTVLLVEDDDQLRHVAAGILTRGGYRVLAAATPDEAIQLASGNGTIDLLLTDVILPSMNGLQLAESLRARRPDTRVVYMSGYAGDAIVHHGLLQDGVTFLQKPFTPRGLLEAIRSAAAAG